MKLRFIFASLLELAGITGLSVGLWWLAPWVGMVSAGVGLVLLGLAVDPPQARRGES